MKQNYLTITFLLFFSAMLIYSCKDSGIKQPVNAEMGKTETGYVEMGKNIVTETQSVLAKNLMDAISQGGPENAVQFCNVKAIMLSDSMANVLNSGIKRVTDRPRNPANQANENELEYLNILKDKMQKGEKPEARVSEKEGKVVGLYPIVTNSMCLQCHGKQSDINSATFAKINKLYPADKATGYGNNELRGLWVVEMIKK